MKLKLSKIYFFLFILFCLRVFCISTCSFQSAESTAVRAVKCAVLYWTYIIGDHGVWSFYQLNDISFRQLLYTFTTHTEVKINTDSYFVCKYWISSNWKNQTFNGILLMLLHISFTVVVWRIYKFKYLLTTCFGCCETYSTNTKVGPVAVCVNYARIIRWSATCHIWVNA